MRVRYDTARRPDTADGAAAREERHDRPSPPAMHKLGPERRLLGRGDVGAQLHERLLRASVQIPPAACGMCYHHEAHRRAAGRGRGDGLPPGVIGVANDCWQLGNDEGLGREPTGTDRDQTR